MGMTFLAMPVLVIDNLPEKANSAEAVETVATTETTARPTTTTLAPTTSTTSTTVAPTTTTTPPTTAVPTTSPPTTRPAPPPTTAPPPTAPPATEPPTTAPPSPPPAAGSVEEIIHAHFGPAGDQAVAIARCESGLNPSARNPAGYYGLFQLNVSHAASFEAVTGQPFDQAWSDADANTRYAKYMYDRSGWSAWGCRHVVG